jgi:hypothetical protein
LSILIWITFKELTGEDGTIHAKTSGANWIRGRVTEYLSKGQFKNQVNTEAKNFILKVESEARLGYEAKASAHGEAKAHTASH